MKARIPKTSAGTAPQNMSAMIKQAQKMQNEITRLQDDIEARSFSETVGGGMIEITMSGKKTVESLKINPDAVNPDDVDMLQDLIISAVNACVAKIEEVTEDEMTKITGGVSLPGLF